MKEYFSHDYNAREDEKIKNLMFELSWNGYGLYWALVEMLYLNDGYMQTHYERIAHDLRTDKDTIEKIISNFGLFKIKSDAFYSSSVLHRIKLRKGKSATAKRAAEIRWGKDKSNDANAMQTQSEGNAIKERKEKKEKEIKVKEIVYPFDSRNFKKSWELWKDYRKEIKKPIKGVISEQAALKKISEIAKGSEQAAIAIINQSIENNWQGLFELKINHNEQNSQKQQLTDVMQCLRDKGAF